MRYSKRLAGCVLALALSGCVSDAAPDPAQFVTAATLSDALTRASAAYGVPRDLLAAIAWAETRFDDPHVHEEDAHGAGHASHGLPDVGALHLRPGVTVGREAGVDSLARARALLGLSDAAALESNLGLGVAGAAAVLAELGRETGASPDDLLSWAEAVARYSGHAERPLQVSYARQVYDVLREGVAPVVAFTGEALGVAARRGLAPVESALASSRAVQGSGDYGPALWAPAASSNYTVGREGARPQFVVIHTMQGSYAGSISWFRNTSSRVSAHYSVRSSDGEVTQSVAESNTAWHAGNWYYNTRSVGIEHEGYVADPGRWYTEAMYRSSARLTRALCDRYGIPIDRAHIIGHYQIPRSGSGGACATGATNCGGSGGHTDPGNGGNGWNWSHFMDLVRGGTAPPPPPPPAPRPPPPPPPPPAARFAAELVQVNCPSAARAGERPVAWVEYRNTGTATWAIATTRLGTTNPRDHEGVFFDMENWVARNRPSGVDRATAPGAVGRFSFVIGIPDVPTARVVSENYGLVEEGTTWFGPADTAVRCAVMVEPRAAPPPPPPPPEDAAAPDAPAPDDAAAPDDAPEAPADAAAPDDAPPESDDVTDAAEGDGDVLRAAPEGTPGCTCRTAPGRSDTRRSGAITATALCALALAAGRRSRARR